MCATPSKSVAPEKHSPAPFDPLRLSYRTMSAIEFDFKDTLWQTDGNPARIGINIRANAFMEQINLLGGVRVTSYQRENDLLTFRVVLQPSQDTYSVMRFIQQIYRSIYGD